MAEPIISKRCIKCKEIKPINLFNKDKSTKDNHCYTCKDCAKLRTKIWYKTQNGKQRARERYKIYYYTKRGRNAFNKALKKYRNSRKYKIYRQKYCEQNRHRYKAYKAVARAIKKGILICPKRLHCFYCYDNAQEYHHHKGYAKEHRLDVIPVCIKCHRNIPKRLKNQDLMKQA